MNKDYFSLIHCYPMLTENILPLRDSQLIRGFIRSHKSMFSWLTIVNSESFFTPQLLILFLGQAQQQQAPEARQKTSPV